MGLAEVFTFSEAPADAIVRDQLFGNKENVIHTEIYVNITLDPRSADPLVKYGVRSPKFI